MRNSIIILSIFCLIALLSFVKTQQNDEIVSLPGLTQSINFKQYSGMMQISDSKFLHYWFVESQNDPVNDPLVLWLNGGPGCSSLLGLLTENGPFRVQEDGNLGINAWSWNAKANMVFLESPVGVGFSYSTNRKDYTINDQQTAADNYQFLLKFFSKYTQFQSNEFYISGESYAGIYIPTLAQALVNGNKAGNKPFINFKGFLVGNGVTDWNVDVGKGVVDYWYYHGFYSEQLYHELQTVCQGQYYKPSAACGILQIQMNKQVGSVNPYFIIDPCTTSPGNTKRKAFHDAMALTSPLNAYLLPYLCDSDPLTITYLNRKDVKQAIHVNVDTHWVECSSTINYQITTNTTVPIYQELMSEYRLHFFSGDSDAVVPFIGSQRWMNSLNLPLVEDCRGWYYTDTQFGDHSQGGHVTVWENLTFITVRAAGHMVPQYQPERAFYLFNKYLKNEKY
eukprot:TRINITY_DN47_c1_g1_i1.p1 TRINITY_DN47_c1_g1~~TRINITY_DN47_c1_g1_i1.p1  ORF type:complete len:451 (+),score=180.14 TRINITY_DN47_c1_g1_i1:106-1458(+)